jgi:hypothetical protein
MSDRIKRADAIEMLKALNMMLRSPDGKPISDACDALDMAIEALSAEKSNAKTQNSNQENQKSNGDLIYRADAIDAVCDKCPISFKEKCEWKDNGHCSMKVALSALPSAEKSNAKTQNSNQKTQKSTGDLINRADAIELLTEIVFDEPPYFDSETLCRLYAEEQINTLPSAEIAETEPIVIRSRTLMPTKDFKEWAKRIKEVNPNAVVIPCDAEVASAEVQGEWIYCEDNVALCVDGYKCSKCGFFVPWDYEHKSPYFIEDYHFCPNCGARMKGGDDE